MDFRRVTMVAGNFCEHLFLDNQFCRSTCITLLKAHRQISKKRCFEKYRLCDKTCQFSAL